MFENEQRSTRKIPCRPTRQPAIGIGTTQIALRLHRRWKLILCCGLYLPQDMPTPYTFAVFSRNVSCIKRGNYHFAVRPTLISHFFPTNKVM